VPVPIIMRASGGGTVGPRVCVAVMMRVTHDANLAVAPGRDQNRRSARLPTPP
jgi:cobyric acid synthase